MGGTQANVTAEATERVIYVTRDDLECVPQGRAGHRPRETSLSPPRRPGRVASLLPLPGSAVCR